MTPSQQLNLSITAALDVFNATKTPAQPLALLASVHFAMGSDQVINATPAPAPIVTPPHPAPPPTPTPVIALSLIKAGGNYNLGGKTITLPASLTVPVGAPVIIHNGTINFSGGTGATGDGSMACFVVRTNATIILADLRFNIPPNHAVIRTEGGSAKCTNIVQSAGALLWGNGFDRVDITNCYPENPPDKYWLCNFTHRGNILRGDNTACKHVIPQGKNEAAIRIMQVDDSLMVGFVTIGSGMKQDVQDRPAGAPGEVYTQHIWRGCKFDSVDCGNFKDTKDKNFPFGILKLSRWENCILGHFATTAQGANPIGKAMGVDRIEQVNCTIGGKHIASNVITR